MTYIEAGARLSIDGTYRYTLTRRWDDDRGAPVATWVMLNPSVADADRDDMTITRCVSFSRAHYCGSLIVVNLFAFRATDQADLRRAGDPLGPDNAMSVQRALEEAVPGIVVCAWGAGAARMPRSPVVDVLRSSRRSLYCLGRNADGSPRHPARLNGRTMIEPFGF